MRATNDHQFRYADGTRYINIGTTAYVWNLQGDALEDQTLRTLADAPFTKIRMCVFPKHYRYNQNEPEGYPFALLKKGRSVWPATIEESGLGVRFRPHRAEPISAIWKSASTISRRSGSRPTSSFCIPMIVGGFLEMSAAQDDRYLRYLVARLAAFPNVWWSMANEYDFMLPISRSTTGTA